MSHSFDWRCDACERRNQHDFPETSGGGTVAGTIPGGDPAGDEAGTDTTVGAEPSREGAGAGTATAGGRGWRESEKNLECSKCHHQQPMTTDGFDEAGDLRDPIEVCLACGANRL